MSRVEIQLVKAKIGMIKGYPMWFQRLLFARRELDNERIMADYNVQKGNTLNLVMRLRGRVDLNVPQI